ncbi:mannose-6-phosphate isomerase [Weissella uvarum]|uniref:mannose-6-phosphate isomerase, class I n=1 Tax=Weissella uvarum TaxID=1479233 RepID=UPI001961494F|nr:mannose-6-phosphate isomerase, class I [Weissella uvarum]MBM7616836.1 mannose-6-phosphate isomerase [Weissella uvarum]MCM0594712.1 mannose-6-phosphate isomerase, class I [Weissella uvarum]
MAEPLILTADLHEKIWGGTALRDLFGFDIPSDHTGEAWVVSGHPNGPTVVQNGRFAGQNLVDVWQNHPELFGNHPDNQPFPLLVKILDAHTDLSVQVHPADDYAAAHAGELGKTESWYILAATPDAEIYYGHTAQTKAEFDQEVDAADWDQLLQKVPVKAGDFFYVPAGTLHALGAGVVALEIQQSSDTTYRVYDFDRVDQATGIKRRLDLEDAKAVTQVPFVPERPTTHVSQYDDVKQTSLVQADYFNVDDYQLDGSATLHQKTPYSLVTMLEGAMKVTIDGQAYEMKPGMSFVVLADAPDWQVNGTGRFVVGTPGPKSL